MSKFSEMSNEEQEALKARLAERAAKRGSSKPRLFKAVRTERLPDGTTYDMETQPLPYAEAQAMVDAGHYVFIVEVR